MNYQLHAAPLHLDESLSAAPDFSPGIVQDDERLLRALFNPEHIRQGQLLDRAIPVKDLRERGFSVDRATYVTRALVQSKIDGTLSRPRQGRPWIGEGIAILITAEIRNLLVDEQQAFVVIDTATTDNPGHASIYAAQPGKKESQVRELRGLLLPLLENRCSLQEAFRNR